MCFERLLQAFARWQPGNLFDIAAQPILEYRELIVIHNCPCEHSSKLQLSIRFTPSHCLDVQQDWYPMYYPEGMKARVSPVQSIEPHRILAPTRDLNQEPLGPQSRVVTTILPLHTIIVDNNKQVIIPRHWPEEISSQIRPRRLRHFCDPERHWVWILTDKLTCMARFTDLISFFIEAWPPDFGSQPLFCFHNTLMTFVWEMYNLFTQCWWHNYSSTSQNYDSNIW